MGKWMGVICVFLGVVCLLSAVGLVVYNRWEADRAEDTAQALLADVQSIMDEKPQEQFLHEDTVNLPNHLEKRPTEMATVKVGGYDCIGILSVPVLE